MDVDARDLVPFQAIRINLLTQRSILRKNGKLIGPHAKFLSDLNDQLPYAHLFIYFNIEDDFIRLEANRDLLIICLEVFAELIFFDMFVVKSRDVALN